MYKRQGYELNAFIKIRWIDSETITKETADELLGGLDGIIVPGGFGNRGIEGMILAAKYARENQVPYLGICLGMQIAVIEFARTIAGLEEMCIRDSDYIVHMVCAVCSFYGQIDMEAVSGFLFQRLGIKIRKNTVQSGNRFYNRLEGHGVVCGSQGIGIAEINFILSRTFFMMGAFRKNSHLLQRKADLTPDVFTPVFGSHIHIACIIAVSYTHLSITDNAGHGI